MAARTVTSTVRALEVLPSLLRDDPRVSVVFAHDPTSAFGDGVLDLLHDAGCRVMPWHQLADADPDAILTASENVDVPDGDCPVLVLPHGIGFQKLVPDSRSAGTRLSGVVPDALLASGRAWLAVSHPDQEKQLLTAHPETSGRTLLIGDPCLDDLARGLPEAAAHRRALGVRDGRRLVVVSSTWGPTSLLGRDPGLPARLLAELPYDEYRVAAVLHPNVRAAHGEWRIRSLLAPALESGLLLMPPVHAWRSALVAADAVVGDHGSVTLYGAALGKPVLLAAFGEDAVPGTAGALLGRTAPRLDAHGDLRAQVEEAVAAHTPRRHAGAAGLAFADPGQAHARLRTALYRLLRLPEPPSAPLPLPPPPASVPSAAVSSWTVVTTAGTTGGPAAEPLVTVRRHPAAAAGARPETGDAFVHLACDAETERDHRLTAGASVLVRHAPAATAVEARRWIRGTLDRYPGCLLATVPLADGGALTGIRDRGTVATTVAGRGLAADPGPAAAVVYTCLRAGLPLDDRFVTLRAGGTEATVTLRLA
ncbi:hypothetical protein [Streptomyces caatingaensis]|uniref:Translation initiation factor 2 n=1 Tax=Streptomyces caatingaensis TaxID=1678637 RepID=A0A0K9XM85_9ACTN|nr:hypothetical protein [Streptomyces caatingaensis]KNB54440.1 hypothetical protein AC230_00775 [Streptomyces caatingaensis]